MSTAKNKWVSAVRSALKERYSQAAPPAILANSLIGKQYSHLDPRACVNSLIDDALAQLKIVNSDLTAVLNYRFFDKKQIDQTARALNISDDTVNRRQRDGISALTDILWQAEQAKRDVVIKTQLATLPAKTYGNYISLSDLEETVSGALCDESPDHFGVAIIGLGGIGKTSLADRLCRRIIPFLYFSQIIWVRIEAGVGIDSDPDKLWRDAVYGIGRQIEGIDTTVGLPQMESQLRYHFNRQRLLVVVDNIEAVGTISRFTAKIATLAGQSKWLLTTRARPLTHTGIRLYDLAELSQADSLTLIRHEAKSGNNLPLAEAADDQLIPIYQATGGNPMAIKLVTGLANVLPLKHALQNLSSGVGVVDEKVYRPIYKKSWQSLSQDAQLLLQSMLLVGNKGGDADYIESISTLDSNKFWGAMSELLSRSLIEQRGTTFEERYGIHRLTETFLKTDVIPWLDNNV